MNFVGAIMLLAMLGALVFVISLTLADLLLTWIFGERRE